MTVVQACDIAAKETKAKYLASVCEYPELFLIEIRGDDGHYLVDSGYTVNKRTGAFGGCDMILRFQLLMTYGKPKKLEIPEKYRFTEQ